MYMSRKKRIKAKRILLYLFVIAVLGLAGVIYVYPMLTGALTRTAIVEYGNLKVSAVETCYFVRDEKVVKASSSGGIQYYYQEGDLARKGTKIADILASGEAYTAEANCLVSYYVDGLEGVFTPGSISELKKEKAESIEAEPKNIRRESAVAGEPLYKTVDNSAWYVAIWAKPENVIKYEKGKTVYINLPLGEVKGTIHDIIDSGDSWLILLKFTRYYEEMPKIRKIEAEVITSDYEGLIIANRSITTLEGRTGVYVRDISGEFVFTPVSVIASDGEYSLVEGSCFYEKDGENSLKVQTVNAYDEILNHPEKRRNE
ncbi:hypothetical protein MASR2M70_15100 [Bacillota bacterium]